MAKYRSTIYPGLSLYPNGKLKKFAGGELELTDKDDIKSMDAMLDQLEGVERVEDEKPAPKASQKDAKGAKSAPKSVEPETGDAPDVEAMQAVLDEALEAGILEEPAKAEDVIAEGVVAVRIEDGALVQTVAGE